MEKVLFIGHGSPMNALDGNAYADSWKKIGELCTTAKAILCISAHWYLQETRISVTSHPKTIHDFYGFPPELYEITYAVPGSPKLARESAQLLPATVYEDTTRGLDHGAWSVLRHISPEGRKIPVFQLSIDSTLSPEEQYSYGQKLSVLRSKGVLIVGSGNIVHNLGSVSMRMSGGYPWAERFSSYIHQAIVEKKYEAVLSSLHTEADASLAVPTRDHFDPLNYILGAVQQEDSVAVYNHACTMGSISMSSYVFGA